MDDFVADEELEEVLAAVVAADPTGERIGQTLRNSIDQLYDGQHTGRYRWDQLYKTEKTHCGTLVEINLQREFDFDDGDKLDYMIAGFDVDCKYSQSYGGWMIPNEAHGKLCLVVTANDEKATWSAGVVRAREEWLNPGRNRDAKATLSAEGKDQIRWIGVRDMPLPPNVLLDLPSDDVEAIFAAKSGQQRVNELFRRAQQRRIGRGVVATVAQQSDYMKRVRGNGGARTALQGDGIVIFGHYRNHSRLAVQLGLDQLHGGESMSARLAPSHADAVWSAEIDGQWWRVATDDDAVVPAPALPKVSAAG